MRARLFIIAGLLFCLAGCAGKESETRADKLQAWLDQQQYSTWETFYGPDGQQPRKPDGFTLGNRQLLAGIGCTPRDLSRIDPLIGDCKNQRAFPSPLTFTLQWSGNTRELAEFKQQRLRRIVRTSIIVGTCEDKTVKVTLVDCAPTAPESNCLLRLIIVENLGKSTRFSLSFSGLFAELKPLNANTLLINTHLGVFSDHRLRVRPNDDKTEIRLGLGSIGQGKRRFAVLLFVPAKSEPKVAEGLAEAKKLIKDPVPVLEATRKEWRDWRNQIKTSDNNPRREDLVDSLLCLIRTHIGFQAIHTGSLRYAHNRAWVRDNYWVQRALLEAGLKKEARLNLEFFFAAWKDSGLASYYEIAGKRGHGYGNMQVELPHYPVLMVRDAEELAGVEGGRYWPMVKACLNQARLAPNGLQPVNGDESWLLAAGINSLDYVLDNSLLFIAAHEYGADLARRMGDTKSAEKYASLAKQARREMELWFIAPKQSRFAVAVSGAQLQTRQLDEFPATGALSRPVVLGVYPTTDPRIRAGLLQSWQDLNYAEGVRAYSRSNICDGGTPGYLLYAASEAGMGFSDDLSRRVIDRFCSATGNVWELQSETDPAWGTEKRRLWDSAVLLLGLLHQNKFPTKARRAEAYQAPAPLSRLLDDSPQFALLDNDSVAPARELATQLARYYGAPVSLTPWRGTFPGKDNYIFVSPTPPPAPEGGRKTDIFAGDNYQGASFDVGGRTQTIIWVKNRGKVFSDLQGLEYDLLRAALPRRKPTPYPKSDILVAQQIGEMPQGSLAVTMTCDRPVKFACGDQVFEGKQAEFSLDLTKSVPPKTGDLLVTAPTENGKIIALTVSAGARAPAQTFRPQLSPLSPLYGAKARVTVTFPPGWWLVEASNLQSGWNRLSDPIEEIHRSDGHRTYVFQITFPRSGQKAIALRLARPAISPPSPPSPPMPTRRLR